METIKELLEKEQFNKADIVRLLELNKADSKLLFLKSKEVKKQYVGEKVYLRGLIEFSNICAKDCLYCGIRKSNNSNERYDIADDILFMQEYDMDMCGIGPYIESENTQLAKNYKNPLDLDERFQLALKTISILRIMMKDINIAASTALQSIDKVGREKAINVAANIFMPNITPTDFRKEYLLYDNKPCIDESASECQS